MKNWFSALGLFLLKEFDERISFPIRFKVLTSLLAPYLMNCKTILDVGSSDGRLAKRLRDATGCEFTCIDVMPQPNPVIPVIRYGGKKLPFGDKSFDCVMMIDTMHHAEDQGELLREAERVASKFVLIKDHYWKNWFDLIILKISDYIANKPYGVNLQCEYKTLSEWNALFQQHDIEGMERDFFRFTFMDPVGQVIFRLFV